jgi:dTDP-glucose 4,6-dehydratase
VTRVLLTGAAGFVGSHLLRHILATTDWDVVAPLTFRHKGLPPRVWGSVKGHDPERVNVMMLDLTGPVDAVSRRLMGDVDVVMNVASLSHVDDSIRRPVAFVENNVSLILNALELARHLRPKLFLQMSTDEVYGAAPAGRDAEEWSAIEPSNPYSASKAAQEAIAYSYWRTFGVPLVITNTMNIFGEMQGPEKFVPKIMNKLLAGESVPVHASPDGVPGSRFYLHARNLADAWVWLARRYLDGWPASRPAAYTSGDVRPDRFNIVGELEVDNVRMVGAVASAITSYNGRQVKPVWHLEDFHSSRPGHDLRYALDGSKLAAEGWSAPLDFTTSLERTVHWTLDHPEWLE